MMTKTFKLTFQFKLPKVAQLKILTKETVLKIIKAKKGRNSSKPLPFPISIYFQQFGSITFRVGNPKFALIAAGD